MHQCIGTLCILHLGFYGNMFGDEDNVRWGQGTYTDSFGTITSTLYTEPVVLLQSSQLQGSSQIILWMFTDESDLLA